MALPIDRRIVKELIVDDEKLDAVLKFCYLGDMLSVGIGCELATITHCKCAWGKFHHLLHLLANRNLPILTKFFSVPLFLLLTCLIASNI